MRHGSLLGSILAVSAGFGAVLLAPVVRAQGETAAPVASSAPAPAESAAPPVASSAPPAAPAGSTTETPPPATGGGVTVTIGGGSPSDKKDTGAKPEAKPEEKKDPPNPFRGSIAILDQSVTAATFSKGSQQTYQGLYEWWISPRIVYNPMPGMRITLRQDAFKEFTNVQDDFQERREWRFTDTWLSAGYGAPLKAISDKTRFGVGVTLRPGISKMSRANGLYMTLGPSANISQSFALAGDKSPVFKSLSLSVAALYQHAFTRCNTPCGLSDDNLQQRMNSTGRLMTDDQTRPNTLVNSTVLSAFNVGFDIIDKLDFGFSAIYFWQVTKQPSDAPLADGTLVPRSELDTRLRQSSWYLFTLNYAAAKEFDLTLGYYSFGNVLGPDGKYQNPFYNPQGARFFFDVVVHLDAVYTAIAGGGKKGAGSGQGSGRVF